MAYIYLIKKKNSLLPCIVTRYQHQPERPFLTKKSKNFPPKTITYAAFSIFATLAMVADFTLAALGFGGNKYGYQV